MLEIYILAATLNILVRIAPNTMYMHMYGKIIYSYTG